MGDHATQEAGTGAHQVSVDEAVPLQVLHPLAYVLTHAQQHVSAEEPLSLPEEIQKAAPLHELGDDVNGFLLRAHAIELHQLRVGQLPGVKPHSELLQARRPAGGLAGEGLLFNTQRKPGRGH